VSKYTDTRTQGHRHQGTEDTFHGNKDSPLLHLLSGAVQNQAGTDRVSDGHNKAKRENCVKGTVLQAHIHHSLLVSFFHTIGTIRILPPKRFNISGPLFQCTWTNQDPSCCMQSDQLRSFLPCDWTYHNSSCCVIGVIRILLCHSTNHDPFHHAFEPFTILLALQFDQSGPILPYEGPMRSSLLFY
jgi:hypothetical protein